MTQTVATLARPRHQRLLHDSLLVAAHDLGDKPAIVTKEARLSYAELLDQAARLAQALQGQGVERGDRVAIFMDNTAACCVSIFGTLIAGGVFMTVNPQTKADKLSFILDDSEANVLLTESSLARTWSTAIEGNGTVKSVLSVGGGDADARVGDFQETIDAAEPAPADPGTIPVDLAALIYTSGSTGNPKGVMLTHANMVFAAGSISEYLRLSQDDRILSVLPLAFDYGLYQLLMAVRLGATLALERSFVFPAETLKRLDEEEITVFPGVPTVYATLLGMKGERTFPNVTRLTNTAAGLPPDFHTACSSAFRTRSSSACTASPSASGSAISSPSSCTRSRPRSARRSPARRPSCSMPRAGRSSPVRPASSTSAART